MEDSIHIPVGLPVTDPTLSYWQDPPHSIADLRSSPSLPEQADYVIVGSGISGASIAHFLLRKRPDVRMVMLEARRACSGATGRNGGHIKGASYRTFKHNQEVLDFDEACRIAKLEHANFQATLALAKGLDLDCDIRKVETVDAFYDEVQLNDGIETAEYMNKYIHGGTERYSVLDAEETQRRFLCPNAVGGITYEAGSVSAYKLTTGILSSALAQGLNLQTNTRVTDLNQQPDGSWQVVTSRGTILTPRIILATNGYIAHLEPKFQGTIVPLRGQMSAQRPGAKLPLPLPNTYTFNYSKGYEYMIPHPAGSEHAGDILIGGGWATLPDQGQCEFGVVDDSIINPGISDYLTECTVNYFGERNWGSDHRGGRIKREWTGIMGTSADGLPYVGEMPGRRGMWVSASFNGHGMALCLKSAEALVTMLVGTEEENKLLDEWFPRAFRVSEDRLGKRFEGRRNPQPPPAAKAVEGNGHL